MDAFFDDSICAVTNLLAEVISVEIGAVRRSEVFPKDVRRVHASVVGSAPELLLATTVVLACTIVEKSESTVLLMVLLEHFLIPEGLPVFFQLPGERVLYFARMIHILHGHQGAMGR